MPIRSQGVVVVVVAEVEVELEVAVKGAEAEDDGMRVEVSFIVRVIRASFSRVYLLTE